MALIIGSARHDENGNYRGGRNGDQDGTEVSTQTFYMHPKGWVLLRVINPEHAAKLAQAMLDACANSHIGYDQNDRNLIKIVKKYGSIAKIVVDTDTDCSGLVRACIYQATGIDTGDFYTGNEADALYKTGLFEKPVDVTAETVLYDGDVLVTKTKGHTVIVVSGRPRVNESKAKTGWIKAGDKWYYRIAEGVNAHGWRNIKNADGKTRRYYFNDKGEMLTGWQPISNKWYYFEPSGGVEGALYVSDSMGAQSVWTA